MYLAPSQYEAGFMSLAHTEADVDKTIAAKVLGEASQLPHTFTCRVASTVAARGQSVGRVRVRRGPRCPAGDAAEA